MSNLVVLVTGSRSVPRTHWVPLVRNALQSAHEAADELIVIHGACPHPKRQPGDQIMASIDMLANEWANALDLNVLKFPADWSEGRNAGLRRNEFMVDTLIGMSFGPWNSSVLAFSPDIDRTGTGHCVRYARKMGLNVVYYDGANPVQFLLATSSL